MYAGRGLSNREAGSGRYRRQHALEAFACTFSVWRQLRRYDRRPGMDFGSGMRRNEPDDALDLCRLIANLCVDATLSEPAEAKRDVRVDHDFQDQRIGERVDRQHKSLT